MVAALIIFALQKDLIWKVVDASTVLMAVVQTMQQLPVVQMRKAVDANTQNMVVVQTVTLLQLDLNFKAVLVSPISLVAVLMV